MWCSEQLVKHNGPTGIPLVTREALRTVLLQVQLFVKEVFDGKLLPAGHSLLLMDRAWLPCMICVGGWAGIVAVLCIKIDTDM